MYAVADTRARGRIPLLAGRTAFPLIPDIERPRPSPAPGTHRRSGQRSTRRWRVSGRLPRALKTREKRRANAEKISQVGKDLFLRARARTGDRGEVILHVVCEEILPRHLLPPVPRHCLAGERGGGRPGPRSCVSHKTPAERRENEGGTHAEFITPPKFRGKLSGLVYVQGELTVSVGSILRESPNVTVKIHYYASGNQ